MRVALAAVFLSAATTLCAETVSIRADYWAPINNDPNEANKGIMIDVAKAILEPAGHRVDYKMLPWERSKDGVAEGTFDCIVGALKSDVDSKFVLPKQPWVVSQQTVYARADSNFQQITSVSALSPFLLGVSAGYSYGDELDTYYKKNIDDPTKIYVARGNRPIRELLLRLSTKKIQLALETNVVMDYTLSSTKLNNLVVSVGSPVKQRDELFIACSAKKSTTKSYIQLFDEGLPKLRADGRFAEILAKYGIKDWQ
jgi:polar amino acid transport system substrate-binding protein